MLISKVINYLLLGFIACLIVLLIIFSSFSNPPEHLASFVYKCPEESQKAMETFLEKCTLSPVSCTRAAKATYCLKVKAK